MSFGKHLDLKQGLCFSFQRKTSEALLRGCWPGNVRQLELVIESAVVTALADALRASRAPRDVPRVIPVGAKLVRDLVQAGDAMGGGVASGGGPDELLVKLRQGGSLREVSRDVERQYIEELYARTEGDFVQMAETLLGLSTPEGGRKVRLRFNQLGLRVRRRKMK